MYGLVRKALFKTSPETAHELALESLKLGYAFGVTRLAGSRESLPRKVMGLEFPNPVGLAAGMDKNGDYIDALGDLGFGFIEVGTITPRPQPGNPKPRVFRLETAQGMINRLGFNNKGVDHLVRNAEQRRFKGVLGINIGKNFDTPMERAHEDYLTCLDAVYPVAEYVTLNISSPNTQGLRALHGREELDGLLGPVVDRREALAGQHRRHVPLALKVAPDLDERAVPEIAAAVERHGVEAVIATNTTIDRAGVETLPHGQETGGLSGAPLFDRANTVLAQFREALDEGIALIGVGGICTGGDAAEKVRLGADLVQFYTGFVYRGPDLVAESVRAIRDLETA
ncbi:MAG: quinone-dependent dihydroorotate dehydrogenase [Xanthomonadales bacterium]|jgi:dihydroorotate dehydrogenase|nr:quinone-dependent dihydroorotate dehydrogenase [Xanthomonadales bacterium]